MLQVLGSSWALLLGVMLLMVGNGVQGTLLGIRGDLEGFSTLAISLVMSSYFAGFLAGSWYAPTMIRRVGHVRVFAALGSLISAALVLFPVLTEPVSWMALRMLIGFCFSGVYVTAESWLNNAATNENRGKALSLYLIVQMMGIIAAQALVGLGDPSGFVVFILPSVLVSVAFAPILLSISPTPAFETAKPLSLRALYEISPLGVIGVVVLGAVFAALFGMAAVYGRAAGFSVGEISTFVAAIYLGGLVLQYPIGWVSDRMDRRGLILAVSGLGALAAALPLAVPGSFLAALTAAFLIGGMTNPLYALLIAHVNDYLELDDMPAASSGMVFMNGLGAIAGPLVTGWALQVLGPGGFFVYTGALLAGLAAWGAWRMTQRPATEQEEQGIFVTVAPTASPVAIDMMQEVYAEAAEAAEAEAHHATHAAGHGARPGQNGADAA